MADPIVIVGAGQAGAALAAKLRALGYAGPLALIGEEPVLPYQRPPLSKKYVSRELEFDRLLVRPAELVRRAADRPASRLLRSRR